MNYYEEVAKLLGLELEEEFQIECSRFNYKITEDGILYKVSEKWKESEINFNFLTPDKIVKLPWKPKTMETYWYIDLLEENCVDSWEWSDDNFDRILFKRGLVFKTKEEALAKVKELGW